MPDKDVVLFNRDRFMPFEQTLYHAIVCKNGNCFCGAVEVSGPSGAPNLKPLRQERSFWIGPRTSSEPLPRAVLELPQVKAAIAKRMLEVVGEKTLNTVQVYR